jgi:energy-converting hydrogenase Eha subunit C
MTAADLFVRQYVRVIIVLLILLFGVWLRLWDIGTTPFAGETKDEYAWTFLGSSLLETGIPYSWSYFAYENQEDLIIQNMYFPIVTPALDHPPLFSLIPGSIQFLFGNTWKEPLSLEILRLPMILIAAVNMLLLFIFSRTWMGFLPSVLALFLYAVCPAIVLSNRVILADNLLVTFFLTHLLLLGQPSSTGWRFGALVSLAILNPLTKIATLAFSAGHFLSAMLEKRWKEMAALSVGTSIGIALLLWYASWFDLDQFLRIQELQGTNRHTTFLTPFLMFFGKSRVIDTVFFDGILISGKIAFFGLLFCMPKERPVQRMYFLSLFYTLFLSVVSAELYQDAQAIETTTGRANYGWYWYPLYPVFMMCLAHALHQAWETRNRFLITAFALFFILQIRLAVLHLGWVTIGYGGIPDIAVTAVFGTILLVQFLPARLWRCGVICLFLVVVVSSITAILNFRNDVYQQDGGDYFSLL